MCLDSNQPSYLILLPSLHLGFQADDWEIRLSYTIGSRLTSHKQLVAAPSFWLLLRTYEEHLTTR
jgi:hypothetical protein